jgi:hypothetical protein
MLCPRCYGKHVVLLSGTRVPCPECAGTGALTCCDGARDQDCATDQPKPQPAQATEGERTGC